MKIFKILSIFALACLSLIFSACKEKNDFLTEYKQQIQTSSQKVSFNARLALSETENARGLMNVKELPQNSGMIFVASMPRKASFWMKNTFIPLDIAFVDAYGKILQIAKMYPHSQQSVQSNSSEVLYCIEMNQGWFEKNGVASGDKLDMQLFQKSLEKRSQK